MSLARRYFPGVLVGLAAMGSGLRRADATVLFSRTVDELAREADAVVIATPLNDRASRWLHGRIVTEVTARVDAVITGRVAVGSTVVVRTPGGVVGEVGQSLEGSPSLSADVPAVLFLTAPRSGARAVLSLAAGVMPVTVAPSGAVMVLPARTEGLTMLPPPTPSPTPRVVVPPGGVALDAFVARVREVAR